MEKKKIIKKNSQTSEDLKVLLGEYFSLVAQEVGVYKKSLTKKIDLLEKKIKKLKRNKKWENI